MISTVALAVVTVAILVQVTVAILVQLFEKRPTPGPDYMRTGVTHDYTKQTWGHTLHGPVGVRMLAGHGPLLGRIKEGDWLLAKLQSGRVGRLLIIQIQYFQDPDDMWTANFINDGYVN